VRNCHLSVPIPAAMPESEARRLWDAHDASAFCWELGRDAPVSQFRDGECEARQLWAEAVAEALNWDLDELLRLRLLMRCEPHVRGLGYNQNAVEDL